MMHGGVSEKTWKKITQTCAHFSEVQRVILYGSRARGDYKEGSDIDLAIDAPTMTHQRFALLWNALDDLPIIYSLDIVHLQQVMNESLIRAIKIDGVTLNQRE